jgi:hypothetical protein
MGFISDNTRSRWGRRRQYVFIGAIMLGVAFVMMWQLYREDGLAYNFAYFLFWSLVFFTGLTVFSIPYVAMGYDYIALGGLVRTPTAEILEVLQQVHDVVPASVKVHLFGLARIASIAGA